LSRTLEGEAGFNDPIAVVLVLVMIDLILEPAYGAGDALVFIVREIGIGTITGLLVGAVAAFAARRAPELPSGTALVASFAIAAIAYGAAAALGGSGFVAVYLAGLALGDVSSREKPAVLAFHNGLASVAEFGMFLALGLLVFPSQLGDVAVKGLLLAAVMAFVARPIATFLATCGQRFSRSERVLLGWAGLRGAVPVILATLPVIRHVPQSLDFFNIVFFAVLLSAAIQGATIQPLATTLKLGERVAIPTT
jgi:cell volume regulation protein A